MRGVPTSEFDINLIQTLRGQGKTVGEICLQTGKSKAVVSKYIQGVQLDQKTVSALQLKKGHSKQRSLEAWKRQAEIAESLITDISHREKIFMLASLYWAEGTKSEFNIINSDPRLLKVFISCLKEIGITTDRLRVTLRLYSDLNPKAVISFWSDALGLPHSCIQNTNILKGKKEGKLPYGMCRIRVSKGKTEFKLVMSLIKRISSLL